MATRIPRKHRRRSIRLAGYDYAQPGAYFITICTKDHASLFGSILDGAMVLNAHGRIVTEEWTKTATIRDDIELDEWVVMPNHVHGVIWITRDDGGTARRAPTERFGGPVAGSLPTIIRSFKSAVTKRVNESRHVPGARLWQRNYYEHIIRNDELLNRIRQYIRENPAQWAFDRENPDALPEADDPRRGRLEHDVEVTQRGRGTACRARTGEETGVGGDDAAASQRDGGRLEHDVEVTQRGRGTACRARTGEETGVGGPVIHEADEPEALDEVEGDTDVAGADAIAAVPEEAEA